MLFNSVFQACLNQVYILVQRNEGHNVTKSLQFALEKKKIKTISIICKPVSQAKDVSVKSLYAVGTPPIYLPH